jgi:VWFA-related protein
MSRTIAKRFPAVVLCASALYGGAVVAAQRKAKTAPQDAPFKFESKVNVVLLPVLVRDAQGRAIGNLTKQDFQVFDKGKPQVISGFTVEMRAGESTGGKVERGAPVTGSSTAPVPVIPQRFIMFLFDDLHLKPGDLARVRNAATRILAGSLERSDAAAVLSTSGRTNTGFTHDQAKLEDAMMKLRPETLYDHVHGCPDVTYYQADLILNMGDQMALAEAVSDAGRCSAAGLSLAKEMALSAAERELAIGEQSTRVTLGMIRELVGQMGALPGQHTLILVSPGFLATTLEARTEKARVIDTTAQANVTVNALDARGLYTAMMDTSERDVTWVKEQYHHEALTTDEDVMAELSSGTGGTYFHNSNDLEGGFKRLTMAPEYLYLLEFSPQSVKQDGSYHPVKVTVNTEGAKIQARHGYFAEKPVKAKKK